MDATKATRVETRSSKTNRDNDFVHKMDNVIKEICRVAADFTSPFFTPSNDAMSRRIHYIDTKCLYLSRAKFDVSPKYNYCLSKIQYAKDIISMEAAKPKYNMLYLSDELYRIAYDMYNHTNDLR